MGKIIIFLIIIAIIYFLFIKTNKKEIKKTEENENEFVQCENCNMFVLKKEAIKKNGKYYCKECNADS
jgi:uncharacterized protein